MQQDAVAAVIVEVVRVAGIIVGDALDHGYIAVGVGLSVVIVETIYMDAGAGIVGGAATGDAHIAESRLALVLRPTSHGDAVLAEAARLDVLDADMLQPFAARQGVEDRHAAALVCAPVLAFDDQVPDYHAAAVLDRDARTIVGAEYGAAADGVPVIFTTRLPWNVSPARKSSRSPGRSSCRPARATVFQAPSGPVPSCESSPEALT